ncbi:hypothetical protein ACA910_014318 [Epithemia clementina (nom. ined.)]
MNAIAIPSAAAAAAELDQMDDLWEQCLQQAGRQHRAAAASLQPKNSTGPWLLPTTQLGRRVYWHVHTQTPRRNSTAAHDETFVRQFVINTFLFTVRSPLSRLTSAFYYHRHQLLKKQQQQQNNKKKQAAKQNAQPRQNSPLSSSSEKKDHRKDDTVDAQFLLHCFRSMDEIAQALLLVESSSSLSTTDSSCVRLARQILSGHGPDGHLALQHFYHNYQYYLERTIGKDGDNPTNTARPDPAAAAAAVVVLRMTHLWDDVRLIERALQQLPQAQAQSQSQSPLLLQPEAKVRHGRPEYEGISTARGRRAVCCHIWDELQAYVRLIGLAVNLNDSGKCQAVTEMWNDCRIRVGQSEQPPVANYDKVDKYHDQEPTKTAAATTTTTTTAEAATMLDSVPCQLLRRNQPWPWELWFNQSCAAI